MTAGRDLPTPGDPAARSLADEWDSISPEEARAAAEVAGDRIGPQSFAGLGDLVLNALGMVAFRVDPVRIAQHLSEWDWHLNWFRPINVVPRVACMPGPPQALIPRRARSVSFEVRPDPVDSVRDLGIVTVDGIEHVVTTHCTSSNPQ